jgi:hypothetical protein
MHHELKQNGSVCHLLRNELTAENLHAGALHGDEWSKLLMQTKQINEVRFLDRIISETNFGKAPGFCCTNGMNLSTSSTYALEEGNRGDRSGTNRDVLGSPRRCQEVNGTKGTVAEAPEATTVRAHSGEPPRVVVVVVVVVAGHVHDKCRRVPGVSPTNAPMPIWCTAALEELPGVPPRGERGRERKLRVERGREEGRYFRRLYSRNP